MGWLRHGLVGSLKIYVSFAKEPYQKRLYSANATCYLKEPTNRSHPISLCDFSAPAISGKNERSDSGSFWKKELTQAESAFSLRVEFLLKTDSGYPRDTEVTLFTLATSGNPLRYNTHLSFLISLKIAGQTVHVCRYPPWPRSDQRQGQGGLTQQLSPLLMPTCLFETKNRLPRARSTGSKKKISHQ